MEQIKKIMVLGSNSFTGSGFIDYALENSNARVIGISRSKEYNPIFLAYNYRKTSKNFTFHQLDVNTQLNKVLSVIDQEKPEVIVNYAAQGEVRNSWKWPEQWFETNCMAIVKLTNHLKEKGYLKRYISVSTPEVYGTTANNVPENFNYKPSTPYGASKLAGDLFLYALYKKYNFPVVFTRSANVFGMHQQLYRIIPRTVIYLKLGKTIELHGKGNVIRSFIHVQDVANATWKAIEKGSNGEIYHIAKKGKGLTIKNLVRLICDMMGGDFKKSTKEIEENFGQDEVYSLDSSKARKELDWKDTITLEEGIKGTIGWIEDNWKEIKQLPKEYIHKI